MSIKLDDAPSRLGGGQTILFSKIDARHRHTGNTRQIVAGELMGQMAGVAICKYEGDTGFYLFGCDENWKTITDTWHRSLEEAKDQAEFEYEGISSTWQTL